MSSSLFSKSSAPSKLELAIRTSKETQVLPKVDPAGLETNFSDGTLELAASGREAHLNNSRRIQESVVRDQGRYSWLATRASINNNMSMRVNATQAGTQIGYIQHQHQLQQNDVQDNNCENLIFENRHATTYHNQPHRTTMGTVRWNRYVLSSPSVNRTSLII
jgi:hypothetical protein